MMDLALADGSGQLLVFDVEDEYHTLRERFSDLVIAGGDQDDCPVDIGYAPALFRLQPVSLRFSLTILKCVC